MQTRPFVSNPGKRNTRPNEKESSPPPKENPKASSSEREQPTKEESSRSQASPRPRIELIVKRLSICGGSIKSVTTPPPAPRNPKIQSGVLLEDVLHRASDIFFIEEDTAAITVKCRRDPLYPTLENVIPGRTPKEKESSPPPKENPKASSSEREQPTKEESSRSQASPRPRIELIVKRLSICGGSIKSVTTPPPAPRNPKIQSGDKCVGLGIDLQDHVRLFLCTSNPCSALQNDRRQETCLRVYSPASIIDKPRDPSLRILPYGYVPVYVVGAFVAAGEIGR
ncbi:hypothetical protein F2Q69_00012658 [Brassica cretica]|uniref:Uncharacterized protein n=1 Tax=Brassica cretica TaxID=69181 RepID=A0A8S9QT10_BRACR|nr:hypothetical protein F2Q69_00012658 [Brassica cretica]